MQRFELPYEKPKQAKDPSEMLDLTDGTPRLYKEARILVDAGIAEMEKDEVNDHVRITKDGSTLVDTDKFSILETAYSAYKSKKEDEILNAEDETSH